MRRLPPAVVAWLVLLALFLGVDLAAKLGVVPGGTFSAWARDHRHWTEPVYVTVCFGLGWHLFARRKKISDGQ